MASRKGPPPRRKKQIRDLHEAGDADIFTPANPEELKQARVLANYGMESEVLLDGEEVRLTNPRRASPVACDEIWTDGRSVLGIAPRGKILARFVEKSGVKILAAHLDQAGVVCSASLPPFHPDFVERYLIFARISELPLFIVLNKMDEAEPGVMEKLDWFREAGVDIYPVSAMSGEGMDALAERLKRGNTILSGLSAVGKSTVINKLVPDADIPTQSVGEKTKRGRHTTTTSRAYPFHGVFLIDSPGIRRFGFIGIKREEIKKGFPDFEEYAEECRFTDCLHAEEEGCAVKAAVESGEMPEARYESYRSLLDLIGE